MPRTSSPTSSIGCFGTFLMATSVIATSIAATSGQAQTLGPLVKVSGGTPFNHCTADQESSQPGTNYARSLIEPWIAADPTTAGHLLIGVQQDRWNNGGSRGNKTAVTVDSGRNYVLSLPQGVSQCTGGRLQRSTDPWTAFDANGTGYVFSLAFNNNPSFYVNGESAMLVNRSLDGGVTWQPPVTVIDDTDPLVFNDKNSLSADPTQPGYVYTVWDRLYGPPYLFIVGSEERSGSASDEVVTGLTAARARAKAARAAAAAGQPNPYDYFGPTYYARSTDSGQSFERAVPIYDPGRGAQTIGNIVVVQPDGTLYDFFTNIDKFGNFTIKSVRSRDHGFSWSRSAAQAVSATYFGSGEAVTPDSKQPIRQADIIFSVTSDPNTGLLGIAFESKGPSGDALTAIYYAQSLDGVTWSVPVKISQTPRSSVRPLRGQAFNMAVAAGANDTLVATYYDFRNDTGAAGQELADMWVLFCTYDNPNDCTKRANWGREARMTASSFNILTAPYSTGDGYFLGDYFGLIADGQSVFSAFTATTGAPGATDLYSRQINLSRVVAAR